MCVRYTFTHPFLFSRKMSLPLGHRLFFFFWFNDDALANRDIREENVRDAAGDIHTHTHTCDVRVVYACILLRVRRERFSSRVTVCASRVCVRVCVLCVGQRESAHARLAAPLCVGERALACVRGGERVSVSHLTTTRVVRAIVWTSPGEREHGKTRELRRKSRWRARGFIARRLRRSDAQNRFILSARSARRTR